MRSNIRFLLFVFVFFVGCAKEKTQDDWQKERVAEDLAKLQQVDGIYQGVLYSKKDGKQIGPMTLVFQAGTKFSGRGSTTSAEEAVLRVNITVHGVSGGTISFDDAYYEPETSGFRTNISFKGENNTIDLELFGHIKGDTVEGELQADGFSDSGASFQLVKNAQLPTVELSEQETKRPIQLYEGYTKENRRRPEKMTLMILRQVSRNEQKLIDLLMPTQYVQVTWSFDETLKILFPNAQYDERVGTIVGRAEYTNSSVGNVYYYIECRKFETEKKVGLRCTYTNSRMTTIHVDFFPTETIQ
ncbi:MAG: hypothetical protein AB7F43_01125 [Bacteriovoracia bacterium]